MPRHTTNPVIVFDDSGRVVDANEAAANLIEVPLADLRRMHLRDTYHPDELPAGEARLRNIEIGQEIEFERWLRCCNRRYVRVAVKASRRSVGGYRSEYRVLSAEPVDLPSKLSSVA